MRTADLMNSEPLQLVSSSGRLVVLRLTRRLVGYARYVPYYANQTAKLDK